MSKTIVNIITEDNPIPAYLFIKEKYEVGDRLMYISAKDTEDDLDALSELFSIPSTHIEEIVLKHDMDEFSYEKICRVVLARLNHESHYCVNLAGGTRYMALAVQQVFEKFDSEFFYVQLEENLIVRSVFDERIYNNDDSFFPIQYRMSVAEYLRVHEIDSDLTKFVHSPIRSEAEAVHFFTLFSQQLLTSMDYEVMELLRIHYRDRKRINIASVQKSSNPKRPMISNLTNFLRHVGFIPMVEGYLGRSELEYLTGGWFEEYVYYLVKRHVQPQDLSIGVRISRNGVRHNNELDVVFTKGNKLFVIECKTGVQTERMFNEIVYKLCAIKEALLGVSCCSYIFSLKRDDSDVLKKIAANMDITFVDHAVLLSPRKMRVAMSSIDRLSKDRWLV